MKKLSRKTKYPYNSKKELEEYAKIAEELTWRLNIYIGNQIRILWKVVESKGILKYLNIILLDVKDKGYE